MKTRPTIIAGILVLVFQFGPAHAGETNWAALRQLLYTDSNSTVTPQQQKPQPQPKASATPQPQQQPQPPAQAQTQAPTQTQLQQQTQPSPGTNVPAMLATEMTADSLDDRQKLGPGDRVMYQVIEDQDPPRSLTVTETGDLPTPYYGLVSASGKTCRQLAGEIKTKLEKKLYYQATVVVAIEVANKAFVTGKVYVTGQVKQPGGFEIPAAENLTVSKAILNAGGFSDFSDKKHVRLVRKTAQGEKTYEINVVDVWAGHLTNDLPVQAGDMVVVPARLINY
jgi:protein involved in polysaccharide export with SLBB domain